MSHYERNGGAFGITLILFGFAAYLTHFVYLLHYVTETDTVDSLGYLVFLAFSTLVMPVGLFHGIVRWFIGF